MPSPANPDPMIAIRTSRTARARVGAGAGEVSGVPTARAARLGLGSHAQPATTALSSAQFGRLPPDPAIRGAPMARTRTPLAGQNVLITGAARGLGAALARKAATRGARVALVGLEP